jgi:phosphoribosylglycinamide formyltransferase-1
MRKKRLALFASGSGSNAENLIRYFSSHPTIEIVEVLCNKPNAFVLQRCQTLQTPSFVFNRADFYDHSVVVDRLLNQNVDYVVLAGFLWLIPTSLVKAFPNRILNIHPSLLPKFGGKGMYGAYVHEAVFKAKETVTGITIHLVNEHYDEGKIIAQFSCPLEAVDTPELIAEKVHQLEYTHLPKVVEDFIAQSS